MKRLLILALLLTACQFHLIRKPPPVDIAPKVAPPTAVDAPLLWTPTPEPKP